MTKFSALLKEHDVIELDDPVVQPDRWFLLGLFAGVVTGFFIGIFVALEYIRGA